MNRDFAGSVALDADAYPSRIGQAQAQPVGMQTTVWLQRGLVVAVLGGCIVLGMGIGWYVADRRAYVAGACIALDMVEAHGAIDEPRRKRIIQSFTSVTNPLVDRFFVTRSEMLRACSELRASRLRDS